MEAEERILREALQSHVLWIREDGSRSPEYFEAWGALKALCERVRSLERELLVSEGMVTALEGKLAKVRAVTSGVSYK